MSILPVSRNLSLKGHVAIVSGGARGIGLAIGQWFLNHGYKVALLDVDQATLAATERTLARPGDVLALH